MAPTPRITFHVPSRTRQGQYGSYAARGPRTPSGLASWTNGHLVRILPHGGIRTLPRRDPSSRSVETGTRSNDRTIETNRVEDRPVLVLPRRPSEGRTKSRTRTYPLSNGSFRAGTRRRSSSERDLLRMPRVSRHARRCLRRLECSLRSYGFRLHGWVRDHGAIGGP